MNVTHGRRKTSVLGRSILPSDWGDIASAVTVLGVATYAAARLVTEGFYAEFGLSPDDVGVSYTSIIVPAALLLAMATCTLIFVWALIQLLLSALRSGRGRTILVTAAGLIVLVAGVALVVLPGPGFLVVAVGLAILGSGSSALSFTIRRMAQLGGLAASPKPAEPDTDRAGESHTSKPSERETSERWAPIRFPLVAIAGVTIIAGALFGASQAGHSLGQRAAIGDDLNLYPFSVLRVSSLGAEPVTVTMIEGAAGSMSGEYLLLGVNQGQLVLFDPTRSRLVWMPTGSATITTR